MSNALLEKRRKEFKDTFEVIDSELVCIYCRERIRYKRRYDLNRHLKSVTHSKNYEFAKNNKNLSNRSREVHGRTTRSAEQLQFNLDLCAMFLAADIPLNKLNHPNVKNFLIKYTKHNIPDESTLRKNCVPKLQNKKIEIQLGKINSTDETSLSEDCLPKLGDSIEIKEERIDSLDGSIPGEDSMPKLFNRNLDIKQEKIDSLEESTLTEACLPKLFIGTLDIKQEIFDVLPN